MPAAAKEHSSTLSLAVQVSLGLSAENATNLIQEHYTHSPSPVSPHLTIEIPLLDLISEIPAVLLVHVTHKVVGRSLVAKIHPCHRKPGVRRMAKVRGTQGVAKRW